MRHCPVMVEEVMFYLGPKAGQVVVDCTVGDGGHACRILDLVGGDGLLIGLDRDTEMLEGAREKLGGYPNVRLVHADFRDLARVIARMGVPCVDGLFFDLGFSSRQVDNPERGFSFRAAGPLDMRFDRSGGRTALEVVNSLGERELARVIREYGEEPRARRIAKAIVEARRSGSLTGTTQLKELVVRGTGGRHGAAHAATRTFQAFRIAVNDELGALEAAMAALPGVVKPGGRVVVISFHSLEDRIVKRSFGALARSGRARLLTRKPVLPSRAQVSENPRARSAKLRAMEAVGP